MAANYEMTHVPEAVCNSVFYYMLCRYDAYELHWALTNCLDMIEGSNLFDQEQAVAYANMKSAAIPSAVMEGMDVVG